jgi:hypothetical protein
MTETEKIYVSLYLAEITADAGWLLQNEPQTEQGGMNLNAIRTNARKLREMLLDARP